MQAIVARLVLLKRSACASPRMAAVFGTMLTSVLTRGFSIAASLLSVPVVIHYAGQERYGLWMTAIAVSTFFSIADGGVSNGLIALAAKAHGAGDRARIRTLISSALAVTIAFVFAIAAASLVIASRVDWTWAFNLRDPELGREAGAVVAAICVCTAATFPPTVFREARLGLLQGARVNLWDLAGQMVGFAGLLVATWAGLGLVAIAAIWSGAPALMRTVGAAAFLAGSGRDLRPSPRCVEAAASLSLLASGGAFVLYSLMQLLAMQSATVLIARFLGTGAVADFSVVQRLFQQPQTLIAIGLAAQWPAYAEAYGRGDVCWIERHLRQSLAWYTAFATLSYGLLGAFCTPILRAWVGSAITVPEFLVPAMMLYGIVTAVASVFVFFYLSLGKHRALLAGQLGAVAIGLPLSVLLIPRIGSAGAVLAGAAGSFAAIVVPRLLLLRRLLPSTVLPRPEQKFPIPATVEANYEID